MGSTTTHSKVLSFYFLTQKTGVYLHRRIKNFNKNCGPYFKLNIGSTIFVRTFVSSQKIYFRFLYVKIVTPSFRISGYRAHNTFPMIFGYFLKLALNFHIKNCIFTKFLLETVRFKQRRSIRRLKNRGVYARKLRFLHF